MPNLFEKKAKLTGLELHTGALQEVVRCYGGSVRKIKALAMTLDEFTNITPKRCTWDKTGPYHVAFYDEASDTLPVPIVVFDAPAILFKEEDESITEHKIFAITD